MRRIGSVSKFGPRPFPIRTLSLSGSPAGHNCRAIVWLIMTTPGVPSRSRSVKSLPRMSGSKGVEIRGRDRPPAAHAVISPLERTADDNEAQAHVVFQWHATRRAHDRHARQRTQALNAVANELLDSFCLETTAVVQRHAERQHAAGIESRLHGAQGEERRASRPAPISSTSARAICAPTNAERIRPRRAPIPERVPPSSAPD